MEPLLENLPGRGPLILLPEELDARVMGEPSFAGNIAGATTVSWEHLNSGRRSDGTFDVKTWQPNVRSLRGAVLCDLADDVYRDVFNKDAPADSLLDWIRTNRGMGIHWAAVELSRRVFRERVPVDLMNEVTRLYATALGVSDRKTDQQEMIYRITMLLRDNAKLTDYCRKRGG